MKLSGYITKILYSDEKNGYTEFWFKSNEKPILCKGVILFYPKKTPLTLSGEFDDKNIFHIDSFISEGFEHDGVIDFLTSFHEIGTVYAEKIINRTGIDIFQYFRDNRGENEIFDFSRKIYYQIRHIIGCEDLYSKLSKQNVPYSSIRKIYQAYDYRSNEIVDSNPYLLLYHDCSVAVCEAIAHNGKSKIKSYDERRMSGLVYAAMTANSDYGNTKISFHNLCGMIKRMDKLTNYYTSHPLFIAEAVVKDGYVINKEDNDLFIYRSYDYRNEQIIVSNLIRINDTATLLNNHATTEDIEKICKITYSDEQRQILEDLSVSGVKIITGGPGTGKTTLLNGIIKKYIMDNPRKHIQLCAPTGCAARRMQESTGIPATTIHQMLGITPYYTSDERNINDVNADCLIVDECSMIDTYIMSRLLKAVKNGALLIFLGDADQLPSVEPGNVLKDIINTGLFKTYRLNTIHRQLEQSSIIFNAHQVIKGDDCLKFDDNFKLQVFHNEDEILTWIKKMIPLLEKSGIEYKVFSPSRKRKFKTSTGNLNPIIQEIKQKDNDKYIRYGHKKFYMGDRVIFTRNNHTKKYFNGEEGIIIDIQKTAYTTHMSISTDSGPITISASNFDDISLAYAITAHKAQGSECENAIIIIPKEPVSLLKRQLLYVEITRAKKNVLILAEKDALNIAISQHGEFQRTTGLLNKFKDISTFK